MKKTVIVLFVGVWACGVFASTCQWLHREFQLTKGNSGSCAGDIACGDIGNLSKGVYRVRCDARTIGKLSTCRGVGADSCVTQMLEQEKFPEKAGRVDEDGRLSAEQTCIVPNAEVALTKDLEKAVLLQAHEAKLGKKVVHAVFRCAFAGNYDVKSKTKACRLLLFREEPQ